MKSTLKRTWAEINLDAIEYNYRKIRAHIGKNVKFLGVVKADAYGHGAVMVSKKLESLGADYLAVSSIDEAMELRFNGITMPILVLGHTPKEQVDRLICFNITQAVTCEAKAEEYSAQALKYGGTLKIHIKVDTGMSRLGYLCAGDFFENGVDGIVHAVNLPGIEAEGIFTHFAVADENDEDTQESSSSFSQALFPQSRKNGAENSSSATAPTREPRSSIQRLILIWCAPVFCFTATASTQECSALSLS